MVIYTRVASSMLFVTIAGMNSLSSLPIAYDNHLVHSIFQCLNSLIDIVYS